MILQVGGRLVANTSPVAGAKESFWEVGRSTVAPRVRAFIERADAARDVEWVGKWGWPAEVLTAAPLWVCPL